ncbi:MAG: SIMPL domain-containing protein [Flavobacteriaceae bacterium]
MKKSILVLALIFTTMTTFAQTFTNNITVSGIYKYNIAPEYSAKMIVSMSNVYYDTETVSMSEVKSGYLDKLAKIGISSDRLKEDDLYYSMMGYDKEGTVIEFKTKSLEEMKKFLMVKAIGVTKSDTTLEAELTDGAMADYAKGAFENARQKAEAIANKIGRKIGKAIYINDSNYNKIAESMYYGSPTNSREYSISVSFELL